MKNDRDKNISYFIGEKIFRCFENQKAIEKENWKFRLKITRVVSDQN